MSKGRRVATTAALLIAWVGTGLASGKQDISEHYKNKYLVLMRDGLVLAICPEGPCSRTYLRVRVTESGVDTSKHGALEGLADLPGMFTPESVRKGEVLKSSRAAVHGKWLFVWAESLSPHSITRGVGAFQHESHESPSAILMFPVEGGDDQARALIDQWLKPFDTQEEAAKFGNTASGAFVKEVKLGMTPAEVEAALGLPEAKVDLGEKVLYKYKNMTVEFHDGKVTDVR